MLWTAPELLRSNDPELRERGTKKADVYSFAIILQEILFQTHAYDLEDSLYPKGKQLHTISYLIMAHNRHNFHRKVRVFNFIVRTYIESN